VSVTRIGPQQLDPTLESQSRWQGYQWPAACQGLSPKFTASAIVVAGVVWFGAASLRNSQRRHRPPDWAGLRRRAELQAWDISIGPDGSELPSGSGNSTQGSLIFAPAWLCEPVMGRQERRARPCNSSAASRCRPTTIFPSSTSRLRR